MNGSSLPSLLEISHPVRGIRGVFSGIPSDKSISHRACMLAGLAEGNTIVRFAQSTQTTPNLECIPKNIAANIAGDIPGDVVQTIKAIEQMGASIVHQKDNSVKITGVGTRGLQTPTEAIDLGNSGTAARLLMGVIGSYPITATLTGDDSLSSRPMKRAILPLTEMGVVFEARSHNYLPMNTTGSQFLRAINYTLPVPSAQVKTAILLAALRAKGITKVTEPLVIRDHTEKILPAFGYPVLVENLADKSRVISLEGGHTLKAAGEITVPGDFSAAAFAIVAALITPDSDITLKHIGINPTRIGLLDCLIEMRADISLIEPRTTGGEETADIRVRSSKLHGISVPETRVSLMIDEFPILAVAAAFAEGSTHFSGLEELRVKESDRLLTTHSMLTKAGVFSEVDDVHHSLTIEGSTPCPNGGGTVQANFDHRIAMSTLVLGMACKNPMSIISCSPPAYQSSFPRFDQVMNALGSDICKPLLNS